MEIYIDLIFLGNIFQVIIAVAHSHTAGWLMYVVLCSVWWASCIRSLPFTIWMGQTQEVIIMNLLKFYLCFRDILKAWLMTPCRDWGGVKVLLIVSGGCCDSLYICEFLLLFLYLLVTYNWKPRLMQFLCLCWLWIHHLSPALPPSPTAMLP